MQCRISVLCAWLCLIGLAQAQHPKIRLQLTPPAKGGQPAPPADVAQVARRLTELTNALRQQEGRRPLVANSSLATAADSFARFMAAGDKYGHTADGHKPADRVEAAGYDYCITDENIAWLFHTSGFTTEDLARQFFDAWKGSPEHRKNLLNPYLGEIGVAVAKSAKTGRYYAVQEFGRAKSEQIVFEISNTTARKLAYRVDAQEFTLEPRYGRRHKRCTPPKVEIAGYPSSGGPPITLHPGRNDRYIVQADASGRYAIERRRLESDHLASDQPKRAAAPKSAGK